MKWINEEKVVCYADEFITVKSTIDKSVLFEGIIKDLKFHFKFSSDNIKMNNTVECTLPGLAECQYYPFHILGSSITECGGLYDRVSKNKTTYASLDDFSQHTFSFEKSNGEVLFTARLLKVMSVNWFETQGGSRRQRPPYSLLHQEKTQGIGYVDNIYLDPVKQLVSAGIKNTKPLQLTCDTGGWHYALEEYISLGKFVYPDGRMIILEDVQKDTYRQGGKLFWPGAIVKDFVKFEGEKIWYVAKYSQLSNDNKADATIIFNSDYLKGSLLKFEGSFTRQSVAREGKIPGRIRGYIAYYQIQGIVSTVGKDGGEVSEDINLYSESSTIEGIATMQVQPEGFKLLERIHNFSSEQGNVVPAKSIGLEDLVGMGKVKQTFEEFRKFGEYQLMLSSDSDKPDDKEDRLLAIYNKRAQASTEGEASKDIVSLHMAFLGSPGTGKTTVAERIASLLKSYGLVVTNEVPLVVVRSDLVGKYIGHTEEIVREKISKAMGGILFVDEAYTLFESESGNDFGKIALNEIMYAMEQHRDQLVVILAGYTDEMLHMLKNANPGLTSRIPWYFHFDDYSTDEMWEILKQRVERNGYRFETISFEPIKEKTLNYFSILKKELDGIKEDGRTKYLFGNGRGVRTFFHYMQIGLAVRLASDKDKKSDLRTFKLDEIDYAFNTFKKGSEKLTEEKPSKPRIGFHQ